MSWKFDPGLQREVWVEPKRTCGPQCTAMHASDLVGTAKLGGIGSYIRDMPGALYAERQQQVYEHQLKVELELLRAAYEINPPLIYGVDVGGNDKTGWFKLNKEEPVSEAVKRADQVKSDVARLEGQVKELEDHRSKLVKQLDEARRATIMSQRALLVYRDGRTKNIELHVEPDPSQRMGYRPVRWFYETDAPMYPVGCSADYNTAIHQTTPVYKRTFVCASEQAYDAKTIVYVER